MPGLTFVRVGDNNGVQESAAAKTLVSDTKSITKQDQGASIPHDVSRGWAKAMKSLEELRYADDAPAKQKRDAKTKMEDWFKLFRTRTVLSWMFSNALLIIIFTTPSLEKALLQHDITGMFGAETEERQCVPS